MLGDVLRIGGVDYEVIWDGGEGLIGNRPTKQSVPSEHSTRLYNRTGKHVNKGRRQKPDHLDTVERGTSVQDLVHQI